MHKLEIIRHRGPIDFTKGLVSFSNTKCARCGKEPENTAWTVCYGCVGKDYRNDSKPNKIGKARNVHNIIQANKARSTKVTLVCKTCGTEFQTQPNQIRIGRGKYCSRPCASEGLKR